MSYGKTFKRTYSSLDLSDTLRQYSKFVSLQYCKSWDHFVFSLTYPDFPDLFLSSGASCELLYVSSDPAVLPFIQIGATKDLIIYLIRQKFLIMQRDVYICFKDVVSVIVTEGHKFI